ncbi:MAG: acetyl-CoA carboxylase biotin carboxyl carrier protein subunit [Bacteroidia bacterium]|nr:MAG: acetyl-CoA carboxylase biotin carboxyl carrier protein subunit [Bacteroidia bacterium]
MAATGKKLYVLHNKKKYSFKLPLSDTITIGSREYEIKIKEDEKHGTYILWKNRRYPVEILQSKQNKYDILFNDISYSFTIETPFSMQRKRVLDKGRGKSDKEIIVAPMPGKIVEVLVREGADVSKGEAVIILEAMKMQNELQSPVDGKVILVNARADTNVNKDEILIEIKTGK